jgi:hypothetical protein
MPRLYTIGFDAITAIAALEDFFVVVGSVGKLIRMKRVLLSASDQAIPTSQMIQVAAGNITATATLGTVTTPTIQKIDPGDSAAGFTAGVNGTVLGTGTRVSLYHNAFHVYNGLDENFDTDGRTLAQPTASGTGEGLFFELLQAVTGTVHFSGTMWIEETNA